MQIDANSPDEYISKIPEERQVVLKKLRQVIKNNLPEGFSEDMTYGMISYGVPHSIYPSGYHCKPEAPLPFISIASQKNYVALYHMGIYADKEVLDWFTKEYKNQCKYKLDMGKSCIRFKKMSDIPYDLIGELARKITVEEWVSTYESNLKK